MLAARMGDRVLCFCHGTPGSIISGSPDTIIENSPAARVGDLCSNCKGPPNPIIQGNPKTLINNRPAAHLGSAVVCGLVASSASKTVI